MKALRTIAKILLIICLVILIPFITVHLTRLTVYVGVSDPVEQAVVNAFNNKNLVIGSKLKDWVEELGEPDLIVKFEFTYKPYERIFTEFYWLNYGLAVEVEGEHNSIDTALDSKVDGIMIPTQKKLPPIYMSSKYRNRTITNVDDTNIAFNQLLNAKLDGNTIEGITVQDIKTIYPNYDISNHDYYTIPFPFITHRTWLYCVTEENTQGHTTTCLDNFYLISLNDGDQFSLSKYIYFLWAIFFELPFHIVTGK